MTKTFVPASKLGTPFQSPSWRYQVIHYPERFGLGWISSKREVNSGHLSRLIPKGLAPASCYTLPSYFLELQQELPPHLAEQLVKVWNKHYFSNNQHKTTFSSATSNQVPLSLNVRAVKKLNDPFLQRLLLYCFNYQGDKYIEEAIKFYKDPGNSQNKDWINYSIYGGVDDKKLAKDWHKPVQFIEALRLIFYDYSHWPKDKFVQFSLIRQLVNNGELKDSDYHIFRRIYDLGFVGLKSAVGLHNLTPIEKSEVDQYLGAASVGNILNLNYTISNAKDALNFNRVVADFANVNLKKLEIEQKTALLKLHIAKTSKEMGMNEEATIFVEEQELVDHLREASKFDHTPKFPSFIEMKSEEAKIKIESNP